MGERTGSRGSGLRILLVLLGAVVLTAGVWVLAENYTKDFVCGSELACHGEDGREPATADRLATAAGFGIEPADRNGDTLPGPAGSLLVLAGMAVLLTAALMNPADRAAAAYDQASAEPMSPQSQLQRYERLRERGVLTEAEFELRKARLIPPDRVQS